MSDYTFRRSSNSNAFKTIYNIFRKTDQTCIGTVYCGTSSTWTSSANWYAEATLPNDAKVTGFGTSRESAAQSLDRKLMTPEQRAAQEAIWKAQREATDAEQILIYDARRAAKLADPNHQRAALDEALEVLRAMGDDLDTQRAASAIELVLRRLSNASQAPR